MKMTVLIAIATLMTYGAIAQENESNLDLRLGLGTSLLGTGDLQATMIENEVNFKLNNYFALGGGLGYGKSNYGVSEQASFLQLNSNLYLSPLSNNRRNDFRIGTGITWYTISDVKLSWVHYLNGELVEVGYEFDKRKSLGANIVLENTFSINDNLLLGIKLFTQPYTNGDINSGVMMKFGVRI